ncbi:hypothetical protein [Methylobacterium oxalidis]|uniref:Uncharacterized protein n=1 Tax=Methylobacterium oxalidis TaxID=944322 RepID=A0A512J0M3_9HYPH|nr:hypothetical protein [Methylobacterium oxalidis]GEP03419.1 hypothetical protein MOX02_14570 [Methylobacterium oxalidis]GJE30216.1 hypothetical protein LDDCCGHA_0379 [Methylobacterium oxalidis]GLS63376.1 hypothetical protein GCM10007888_17570 [Methylobacterium oxalidis]
MKLKANRTEAQTAPATGLGGPAAKIPEHSWTRRAINEAERYLWFALYLIVVLGTLILFSLNIYVRIDHDVPHYSSHHFYVLGLINALVFAKIMLLAEAVGVGSLLIGRRLEAGRLVTVILYRVSAFTVVLVAAYMVEAVLEGAWHGKTVGQVLPEVAGGPAGLVSLAWILLVALTPYFAYRELGRVLGHTRLRTILLKPGSVVSDGVESQVPTRSPFAAP